MIWTYLGAMLFLVSALVLASREVVPVRHGEPELHAPDLHDERARAAEGLASPSSAPAWSPSPPSSPITVGRARHFAPTVVVAVGAGVAILERWWATAPAFVTLTLVLLPVLTALAVIDIDVHRLPNRLTALLAGLTTVGLLLATSLATPGRTIATVGDDTPGLALRRAFFGGLALGVCYLALALLGGGSGMGLGDVKLAPSLGALTAWLGWDVWMTGALAAFLLGGAWGVVLMLRGHGRHARMPFGPFMIVGALASLVIA